jgi:hypothetical protein
MPCKRRIKRLLAHKIQLPGGLMSSLANFWRCFEMQSTWPGAGDESSSVCLCDDLRPCPFHGQTVAAVKIGILSAKRCRSLMQRETDPRYNLKESRGVAQPGSASALGAEGREFESLRPDHRINNLSIIRLIYNPHETPHEHIPASGVAALVQ